MQLWAILGLGNSRAGLAGYWKHYLRADPFVSYLYGIGNSRHGLP